MTQPRSLRDRYTIRGLVEQDRSNGDKTKDTWWVRNKYDRFSKSDPDNYIGYQLYFEYDKFADLPCARRCASMRGMSCRRNRPHRRRQSALITIGVLTS